MIHQLTNVFQGRGGQSALRFARLRMEKRHNYVRKVAEVAVQLFISNDRPNVAGLVLAGSADFKTELSQSDMFDPVSTESASQHNCLNIFFSSDSKLRF
jgi:peptide subunit release factor 1 (eRF1)